MGTSIARMEGMLSLCVSGDVCQGMCWLETATSCVLKTQTEKDIGPITRRDVSQV